MAIEADPARAGAWTLLAGEGQAIAVGAFVRGDRAFDASGRLLPARNYRKFHLPVRIEYGLGDAVTLIAGPSLLAVSTGTEPPSSYRGLGTAELGGRVRLWSDGAHVIAVQATARLPGARQAQEPAEAGWTDPETDLRALWGYGFALRDLPAFVGVEAAYRRRAGGPADELRLDLTLGVRLLPRWLLLAQTFTTVSIGPAGPGFQEFREHKLSLGVAYTLGAVTVQVGGLATLGGENTLRERGFVAGVWYRF